MSNSGNLEEFRLERDRDAELPTPDKFEIRSKTGRLIAVCDDLATAEELTQLLNTYPNAISKGNRT